MVFAQVFCLQKNQFVKILHIFHTYVIYCAKIKVRLLKILFLVTRDFSDSKGCGDASFTAFENWDLVLVDSEVYYR